MIKLTTDFKADNYIMGHMYTLNVHTTYFKVQHLHNIELPEFIREQGRCNIQFISNNKIAKIKCVGLLF
jgi:hypothetical protein